MCLEKPAKFELHKEGDYYVGYKDFCYGTLDELYGVFFAYKRIPFNTWIHEKDYRGTFIRRIKGWIGYWGYPFIYRKGFHIYNNKGTWSETKVYFKKVVAEGLQDGREIVVAKKMYVSEGE